MKWKLLSLSLLLVLTMTVALLVYMNQGFETKKLVLHALKWGLTPENYLDISNSPFKEEITSLVRTSSLIGPAEITEWSTIKTWAEGILGSSTRERINIKIGENEYYSVTIQYFYHHYSYPKYITQIPLTITICAWIIFAILLAKEKKCQEEHQK